MENRKIRMQTIWKYFENWKMENLGSTKMGKELEYSKIKKTQRLKNGLVAKQRRWRWISKCKTLDCESRVLQSRKKERNVASRRRSRFAISSAIHLAKRKVEWLLARDWRHLSAKKRGIKRKSVLKGKGFDHPPFNISVTNNEIPFFRFVTRSSSHSSIWRLN